MIETLKYPTGDFTHTELAQLNGKTNQQVWTRYQAAIKDGTIISAGTRASAGKGKPSKLWRVNPNPPTPSTTPVVAAVPAAVPTAPAAVVPSTVPTEPIIVPAVAPTPAPEVKLPEAAPAAAPVTEPSAESVTVEVVRVETPAAPSTEIPPTVNHTVKDARTLKETCPICGKPLMAVDDATGVTVWCNQTKEVCPSAENPFGHADNDEKAYKILLDKWTRKTSGAPSRRN